MIGLLNKPVGENLTNIISELVSTMQLAELCRFHTGWELGFQALPRSKEVGGRCNGTPCIPSTREAEAGGSGVQSQPGLRETLSDKTKSIG